MNARGTSQTSFQIGKRGLKLVNDGNKLSATEADGITLAEFRGATGTSNDSYTTKQYVDNAISGLDVKESVRVATTTDPGGTYTVLNDDGTVEATPWTGLGASLTIDGVTLANNDRILIKDATDARGNGIFTVSGVGSNIQFSRASDADNSPENELTSGSFVFVESGNTNGGNGFIVNSGNGVIDLGNDNITFTQFSNSSGGVQSVYGRQGNIVAENGDYNASQITLTPTGSIASTNVQSAIAELSSEKFNTTGGNITGNINAAGSITAETGLVVDGTGTGLTMNTSTAGSGFTLSVTSSQSNEDLVLEPLGTGVVRIGSDTVATEGQKENIPLAEDLGSTTAVHGGTYILAGGETLTLPSSPAVGTIVWVVPQDDWSSSNATVGRNGENIMDSASDFTLDVRQTVQFTYVGGTTGWSI